MAQTLDGGAAAEVASPFNVFFSQVGKKLVAEFLPLAGPPLVDDAAHRLGHDFRLEPVSSSQMEQ